MLLHLATGLTLSSTVTVLLQVETLPLLSVTVRVTGLGPTLAQVKLFGLTLLEARPQAALLPLSPWAGVMQIGRAAVGESGEVSVVGGVWGVGSRLVVILLHLATGLTLSSTGTVLLQVEALPLLSVTVRVTVFGPTLAQVKLFGLTLLEAMPQASLLPLSTSAGMM